MKQEARTVAAKIISAVLLEQKSLSESSKSLEKLDDPRERALAQQLCYGVLRWYFQLDAVLKPFLRKPIKRKEQIVHSLLLIGTYQILHMRTPDHAAVSSTVEVAKALRKNWAVSLINGVLRNLIRAREGLTSQNQPIEVKYSHPQWLIDAIRKDWPDDWQQVLDQNNQQAPLTLRVNQQQSTRDAYLQNLNDEGLEATQTQHSPDGIVLQQTLNPTLLPNFSTGRVSVQDQAAQLAASLLDVKPGHRVLDACAAPGGKTAHILELEPDLDNLIAIDEAANRTILLKETLNRLKLNATIVTSDANDTTQWWNGKQFDRILLDAPCSATGVIRRHPDIKVLRQANDIAKLISKQSELLNSLWPLLASGGRLLYVTCSVLREENDMQIDQFLQVTSDAKETLIEAEWGRKMKTGRQILPGENGMDGFYYACLTKA